MKKVKIFITSAGGEIANPVIKSLKKSNLNIEIVAGDINPDSNGLFRASICYLLPSYDDPNYKTKIKEICKNEQIDLVIPCSDLELIKMAELKESGELECEVCVASTDVINKTFNKLETYKFFRKFGLPFVETVVFSDIEELIEIVKFPIIAKPLSGSGSKGVKVIFSYSDIEERKNWEGYIFQDYLTENKKDIKYEDVVHGNTLVQKSEISCQAYISKKGEVLNIFSSINQLKAGMPTKINPIENHEAEPIVIEMAKKLAVIGLRGPCNFQLKMTDRGPEVFEINSRFTGITGARAEIGCNEVKAVVGEYLYNYTDEELMSCFNADYSKYIIRFYTEIVVEKDEIYRLIDKKKIVLGDE